MEKEDILEKVYETAKRYELKSGGCAQCTIAAIFDVLGEEDEGVFKAATGMADGVGLTGDVHCGEIKAAFKAGMPEKCSTAIGCHSRNQADRHAALSS
ncbi:MAG: hypothetical protein AUK26_04370 [Syntrophaceae bacterium CG2_30_58_14]|nr:MAG: hypothetical protein AUK26_04370 [Syntrophaceae bacterium CG2_30_58_14]